MEQEELNRLYAETLGFVKNSEATEEGAKGMLSDNPEIKVGSRTNLEQLLRASHPGLPTDTMQEFEILRYAKPIEKFYMNAATSRLRTNPEGIINKAVEENKPQFTNSYFLIQPEELKGTEYEKVFGLHKTVYKLHKAVKQLNDPGFGRNPMAKQNFVAETVESVEKEVEQRILSQGGSKEDAEELSQLVRQTYATTSLEGAVNMVQYSVIGGVSEMNRMLPEDKRADYAKQVLYAKAKKGDEGLKETAKNLYSVVSSRPPQRRQEAEE